MSLEAHRREVEAAYLKKRKRGASGMPACPITPRPNPDLHKIRRQCDGLRRDGQPCRAPALKGATRCRRHGGYRQNPAHPGSIARLLNGKLDLAIRSKHAAAVWRDATPAERRTVMAAEIIDARRAHLTINRANGVEALRAAPRDDGASWRKWIATQAAPPNAGDPKYATYEAHARSGA